MTNTSSRGLSNPHDALFKTIFQQVEHAVGLFCSRLPHALIPLLDWNSLTLQSSHFINEQLGRRDSDLIFSIRYLSNPNTTLYFILEHQSTPQRWIPIRLFHYSAHLSEHTLDSKAKHACMILPVVVYHGKCSWTAPTSLEQLYPLDAEIRKAIEPYGVRLSFLLDDLTHLSNEQLQARPMTSIAKLTVLVLRDARFVRDAHAFFRLWNLFLPTIVTHEPYARLLPRIVYYTLQVIGQRVGVETILHAIQQELKDRPKEIVMTALEELQQLGYKKGRKEGLAKGRLENQRRLVLKLIQLKFHSLPLSTRSRVQHASMNDLEHWAENIMTAHSLDEVFAAR